MGELQAFWTGLDLVIPIQRMKGDLEELFISRRVFNSFFVVVRHINLESPRALAPSLSSRHTLRRHRSRSSGITSFRESFLQQRSRTNISLIII